MIHPGQGIGRSRLPLTDGARETWQADCPRAAHRLDHPRPRAGPGLPAPQAPRPGPARSRQSFGTATVFYPEATDERCTAALLLEVDPVRAGARRRGKTRRTSRSRSTSTTARTPRRRCSASPSPTSSARRAAAAATSLPGARRRRRSRCEIELPAAALPRRRRRWPTGSSSRSAGGRRPSRRAGRAVPRVGRLALRAAPADRRRCGSPTRSASSTSCCRCSTTPSTTGRAPTRSTSCCAPAAAGWPAHPEQRADHPPLPRPARRARRRPSSRGSPSSATTSRRRSSRRRRRGGGAAGGESACPLNAPAPRRRPRRPCGELGARPVHRPRLRPGPVAARAARRTRRSPRSPASTCPCAR